MQIELDEKQRFDLRINKPNEKSQNKDKELIYYTSQEVIKKLFEKINSINYKGSKKQNFINFFFEIKKSQSNKDE